MDRVGGVAGFVEDAVLAELGRAQAQRTENVVHDHGGDRRETVVGHGLLADQEVGVGRARPPLVTVAEPVPREGVGEFVEVDGVPQVPSDRQASASEVEIGQEEVAGLASAEAVDGDERESELGHRGAGAVDQAAEPVGGNRHGQARGREQRDASGGVAEDQSFLLEGLEEAAQCAEEIPACRIGPLGDGVLDVVLGDFAKAGDAGGPVGKNRVDVAEVLADRLERHRGVLTAALAAQDHHPAAEFVRDVLGEGLDALLDGSLVDVDLAGGVGDDQATAGEELQDSSCAGAGPVGGQGPDVGLVDGGVGAEAGQQDAEAAGGETPHLFVPALLFRVVPEVVEQGRCCRGEGGQTVEFPDGYAGPVAPGVEQRGLGRVDQEWRDGWCGWSRGGGSLPGLVVRCVIAESPGADREPGCEVTAEPQFGSMSLFVRPGRAGSTFTSRVIANCLRNPSTNAVPREALAQLSWSVTQRAPRED